MERNTIEELHSTLYDTQPSIIDSPIIIQGNNRKPFESLVHPLPTYSMRQPMSKTIESDVDSLSRKIAAYTGRNVRSPEYGIACVPVNPNFYDNPVGRPDFQEESIRFWEYVTTHDRARYQRAEQAVQMFGKPQSSIENSRAVLPVIIAGHQDINRIQTYLPLIDNQKIKNIEIYAYINAPAMQSEQDDILGSQLLQAISGIEKYKMVHSRLNIRHMTGIYRGQEPTMGMIRADLWDAMTLDVYKRGRQQDILAISQDVDPTRMNRDCISGFAESFYSSDNIDIVIAPLYWEKIDGLPLDAMANKILRASTILTSVRDRDRGFGHTWEGVTGISLSSYLASGGYNHGMMLGETEDVVRVIRSRHGYGEPNTPASATNELYTSTPRLVSDSRRQAAYMALGHAPFKVWKADILPFRITDPVRERAIQSSEVERHARANADQWMIDVCQELFINTPADRVARVITALSKILGIQCSFSKS